MSEINSINSNISSITSSSSSGAVSYQSDDEIINLLRQDGMYATKSVQQVAREFNISVMRAQKILDSLNGVDNSERVSSEHIQEYMVNSEITNPYTYSVTEISGSENTTVEYSV